MHYLGYGLGVFGIDSDSLNARGCECGQLGRIPRGQSKCALSFGQQQPRSLSAILASGARDQHHRLRHGDRALELASKSE